MLKCAVALAALMLAGCTTAEHRVDLTIKNTTPDILVIKVGSGMLATSVTIPPGGKWSGWVDRRWIGDRAWVEVRPAIPLPR